MFVTILSCVMSGVLLQIYSKYQSIVSGIKIIGIAFLTSAFAYFFILYQDELGKYFSIILGNSLLLISLLLIYHGFVAIFSSNTISLNIDLLLLIFFILAFAYLLYSYSSIKNRII